MLTKSILIGLHVLNIRTKMSPGRVREAIDPSVHVFFWGGGLLVARELRVGSAFPLERL